MDKLRITGGPRLKGRVKISGAKNSALPAMAASLLTAGEVTLENVPLVNDIFTTRRLLRELGVMVEFEPDHSARLRALDVPSVLGPLTCTSKASKSSARRSGPSMVTSRRRPSVLPDPKLYWTRSPLPGRRI